MKRTGLLLFVFGGLLLMSAYVLAQTCTDPGGGPAQLCADSGRLICEQDNSIAVQFPNATVTANACTTLTVASTAICTNAANGIPCLDSTGKIPVGQERANMTGTGTTGYLPKRKSDGTYTDSVVYDAAGLIGVNTTSPQGAIHLVQSSSEGTPAFGVGGMIVQNNSPGYDAAITVIGSRTGQSRILLGDSDSQTVGSLTYNHNYDYLSFVTNGSEWARLDKYGFLRLGNSAGTGGARVDVEDSTSGGASAYGLISRLSGANGYNTGVFVHASGGTTQNIGLRIVKPDAGGSNYAIYSDATAPSYLAGNLQVNGAAVKLSGLANKATGKLLYDTDGAGTIGEISFPIAGTTTATGTNTATLGGVKCGTGTTCAADGTMSVSPAGIGAVSNASTLATLPPLVMSSTGTITSTVTTTNTGTVTSTGTATGSGTGSGTGANAATGATSGTATTTATGFATSTITARFTATATDTIQNVHPGTVSYTSTSTSTATRTVTGTNTNTAADTGTFFTTGTQSQTVTVTVTSGSSGTATGSFTATGTVVNDITATAVGTVTLTGTATVTGSALRVVTGTGTGTKTATGTQTFAVGTYTATGEITRTASESHTYPTTATVTVTGTASGTVAASILAGAPQTRTYTNTATQTVTTTATASATGTLSVTNTTTVSGTATGLATSTLTASGTWSLLNTFTGTATHTGTGSSTGISVGHLADNLSLGVYVGGVENDVLKRTASGALVPSSLRDDGTGTVAGYVTGATTYDLKLLSNRLAGTEGYAHQRITLGAVGGSSWVIDSAIPAMDAAIGISSLTLTLDNVNVATVFRLGSGGTPAVQFTSNVRTPNLLEIPSAPCGYGRALSTISDGTTTTCVDIGGAGSLSRPINVCAAGEVLTSYSAGVSTCVANGSGSGMACAGGSCTTYRGAMFTNSSSVADAPVSYSGNNSTFLGTVQTSYGFTGNLTGTASGNLVPNGLNSTCTKPTFTNGQATACNSSTPADVGAVASADLFTGYTYGPTTGFNTGGSVQYFETATITITIPTGTHAITVNGTVQVESSSTNKCYVTAYIDGSTAEETFAYGSNYWGGTIPITFRSTVASGARDLKILVRSDSTAIPCTIAARAGRMTYTVTPQ